MDMNNEAGNKEFKRIGVLTSGGDAPGMNAAVRAVTRYALNKGIEVFGIYGGYKGLMEGDERLDSIKKFGCHDVANIINRGGTILYSARCKEYEKREGVLKAADVCRKYGIDGIIAIGGDGTFRGAYDLSTIGGIPCVGIPGSIDNDITCTDHSIGFDTAVNTVIADVDRLRDTCESHARCDVVEVMGRHAGYIALKSAIAVGATAAVIKEDSQYDENALFEKIMQAREAGKRNFIVIVAEGVKDYSEGLAERIEKFTKVETKYAKLAHIVRGGSPTLADRLLASRMGVAAVDLLLDSKTNVFVCERNGKMTATDIKEALTVDKMYKSSFDPDVKYPYDELNNYSGEKIAEMKELCRIRTEEVQDLLKISREISNYRL